jgi:VanZ family protein
MRSLAPPLLLVAVLAALAATPGLETGLGAVDAVGRVLLHLVVYAALFVLVRRALGGRSVPAAALTLAVGVIDELIQSSISSRDATPVDVLVDVVGIGLGWLLDGRPRASRARWR